MTPSDLETWRSGKLAQIDAEIVRLRAMAKGKQADLDADVAKHIDLMSHSLQARLSNDLTAIWVKIGQLDSERRDVELADEMPASPAPAPVAQPEIITASKERKKKPAKDAEETADQELEREADRIFDEMIAESGLSEDKLLKNVSLGFVLQCGAQNIASLKHALKSRDEALNELAKRIQDGDGDALKRIEALERKAGILRDAKPIKKSVTNITAHDAQGRITQTEKLEGGDEEIDLYARVVAVEQRLADSGYRGIWDRAVTYRAGSMVTSDGSAWFAKVDSTGVKPGEQSAGVWVLAVKRGRDGKDAR